MGRLVRKRFASAHALVEELARHGVKARLGKQTDTRPSVIPEMPEILPGCVIELRLTKKGAQVPPFALERAALLWQPHAMYRERGPREPVPPHVQVKDRERIAAWAWWKTLHEAGLFEDAPPESWQEVSLPSEEWEDA